MWASHKCEGDIVDDRRKPLGSKSNEASYWQEVLRRREDIAQIGDLLGDGCAILDNQFRVDYLSNRAAISLGISNCGMQEKPWKELFSQWSGDFNRFRAALRQPDTSTVMTFTSIALGDTRTLTVEVRTHVTHDEFTLLIFRSSAAATTPQPQQTRVGDGRLVGNGEAIRRLLRQVQAVANATSTVLITGETGVGKELVARAIHTGGWRRNQPFLAVNCAGLSDSLLASQLFGHCQGAFTGAVRNHRGFFEVVGDGTLFLDEIGDISPVTQTSLLRVLDERTFMRLGESSPRPTRARVLAATNKDLRVEAIEGRFRWDLLYRIRVIRIGVPPLRKRQQDIPELVDMFLRDFGASLGDLEVTVSPDAMDQLIRYPWPGNVRELRGALESAFLNRTSHCLRPENFPPEMALYDVPRGTEKRRDDSVEGQQLLMMLNKTNGNRSQTAKLLGISRATLYRRLKKYGLVEHR